MERERKRRQMKTAGNEGKTSALQAIKLSFMNSGLISLKKGGLVELLLGKLEPHQMPLPKIMTNSDHLLN